MAKTKTLIYGFWERFEEAVSCSGLSKAEIARRIGVHRHSLYASDHVPSALTIAKVCAITHTSADYLLGLKGGLEEINSDVVNFNSDVVNFTFFEKPINKGLQDTNCNV